MDKASSDIATTPRLLLRNLRESDVTSAYVSGLNDPEVTDQTEARGRRWSEAEIRSYVAESNQPGVSQLIGIFLREGRKHIGNIRLSGISARHQRVDLGIMIFDKAEWGKGYATESLEGVSGYVFKALGFNRICADYHATNTSSARIFAKAGFVREGVFRRHFRVDGAYVDSVRVARLASDPKEGASKS